MSINDITNMLEIEKLNRLKPEGLERQIAKHKGLVYVGKDETYEREDWILLCRAPAIVFPAEKRYEPVPPWVTNVITAMGLLEEIRQAGDPVCVLMVPEGYERADRYEVKVYRHTESGDGAWIHAWAGDLPRAACIAYILWQERRVK